MPEPDPLYALEKLRQACHRFATGTGRVQERLATAAAYLIRIRPEDMPDEELRRAFTGIMDDLT